MTLDTLGVELENRRGPRRVVPLAVAFEFRRVVFYVHPGRQEMLVHEPHHAFVRPQDRKSTRLNSSHTVISYAVFCLKKKKTTKTTHTIQYVKSPIYQTSNII